MLTITTVSVLFVWGDDDVESVSASAIEVCFCKPEKTKTQCSFYLKKLTKNTLAWP